ncbi:M48 family metallopeptidase [bacterium]|nr:M48 family metallopeptidase [bacterium]
MTKRRKGRPPANGPVPLSREAFRDEVAGWVSTMKVEPKEVHVRPMSRKWGSCSTTGRVTFDAGLLEQPAEFRRQVIVHELLHLKVPNHGKLFRALLKAYLGTASVTIQKTHGAQAHVH